MNNHTKHLQNSITSEVNLHSGKKKQLKILLIVAAKSDILIKEPAWNHSDIILVVAFFLVEESDNLNCCICKTKVIYIHPNYGQEWSSLLLISTILLCLINFTAILVSLWKILNSLFLAWRVKSMDNHKHVWAKNMQLQFIQFSWNTCWIVFKLSCKCYNYQVDNFLIIYLCPYCVSCCFAL